MKKSLRTVPFVTLVMLVLLLSGCRKAEAPAQEPVAAVEEKKADTAAETPVPTKAPVVEKETKEETEVNKSEEEKTDTSEPAKEETADQAETDKDSAKTGSDDAAKAEENKAEESQTNAVALKDVYNKIAGSVALPEMYFADAGFLMNYYGIDASKLEDYVFASCLDSTSADSIILMRLKDESSADEVIGGLNMLLEQMSIELESYNPEANELVKAAKVRRNGKNIDLIIHKDRNTILSVIDSSL
ncbi:MAG: DUF4358 domain-containing protein [Lachnospiraceae bacterium]|nr:DUF4358 domain-containing protein [Lachnospiraceae bacterium]